MTRGLGSNTLRGCTPTFWHPQAREQAHADSLLGKRFGSQIEPARQVPIASARAARCSVFSVAVLTALPASTASYYSGRRSRKLDAQHYLPAIYLDRYPSGLGMPSSNPTQSALDLLVLTILNRRGPLHGYAIANAIQNLSDEALRIEEGSLYPALHRIEEAGWITAEWMVTENKRRARIYRVTRAGNKQLAAETERWTNFSTGVARILRLA